MVKTWVKRLYMAFIFLLLYLPIIVLVVLSFNKSKARVAWRGFTFQWYANLFDNSRITDAFTTTLTLAFGSALAATIIGVVGAIGISAMKKRNYSIMLGATNIPMLNADIVTGISLMLAFIAFGVSLGFKTVLIAHITFNIPYVILSVMPKLKQTNRFTYEAALDLGASPLRAFFKVVFPDILPGVLSGFLLAFTMSLDDFIITHFTRGAGINTLSTLIYAQNFSMPAGYVQDASGESWLLKVGEEYNSVDDIAGALLLHVDGYGDVRLSDVADVEVIDNAADSFTRLNGEQAAVLKIYKNATSSASDVSDNCLSAFQELEAQYDGLHIVVLSNQGNYISILIKSILTSMLVGAALAVVVLAIFLKDVKPTLVVGVSIPLSVLCAVVLMYFTGLDLNVMTLAGLSLGIGMLVDNSVVVIENIYRLRGRGVPAARAAVQGARQVGMSVVASTLTSVCVFLPVVFSASIVRSLMMPMSLCIGYCLHRVVRIAVLVCLCNEIQGTGTSQFFQDLVGICYTGDLDIDTIGTLLVYNSLFTVILNTLLQLGNSICHIRCIRLFIAYHLISDTDTTGQIQSQTYV